MGQNSHAGDISPKMDYGIIHIYGTVPILWPSSNPISFSEGQSKTAKLHDTVGRNIYEHVTQA